MARLLSGFVKRFRRPTPDAAFEPAPPDELPMFGVDVVRDDDGAVTDLIIRYANKAAAGAYDAPSLAGRSLVELIGHAGPTVLSLSVAAATSGRPVRQDLEIALDGRPAEERTLYMVPTRDDVLLVRLDLPQSASPRPVPLVLGHEGQFRALVERAADVVLVMAIDGRWRYLSPNAWGVLGLRPERTLGLTNVDVVHPDDLADVVRAVVDVLQAGPGGTVSCEATVLGENDRSTACELVLTNRTDDPDIDGLILTIRDISTRRAEELARRQSDERYRTIVERADEGIVMLGVDGTVQFINASAARFCRLSVEEMVGKPSIDFIHPEDRERLLAAAMASYGPAGHSGRLQCRLWTSDGSLCIVEGSFTRLRAGGPLEGLLVVATDVTETVGARRALEQRELEYRTAVEGATEGLVVTDRQRRIVTVSEGLAARLGYRPSELVSMRLYDLIDPIDYVVMREISDGFRSGRTRHDRRELRFVDRSGARHWMLVSTAARRDVAGDYDGAVTLFLDVEHQRAADEDRRDLAARLVLAAEVERRRLAEDLHDGPVQQLSALALRLGVLAMQSTERALAARATEAEEVVRTTVSGLRSLMFELVPPDLDRNGLARAIKGTAEVVLVDAGVRVEVHDQLAEAPDLTVQTVAYRIAQEALTNVRNHAEASEVVIDLRDADGGIRLEISDNGQGVSPARLHESQPGHLGLESVRRRATEVGGWCEVESEPGKGTKVLAWLPATPQAPRFHPDPSND